MEDENFEGMEIPEELLQEIAGGYMSEGAKAKIRDICADSKSRGNDLERVKRFYRRLAPASGFSTAELWDYMDEIWPTL